MKFVKLKCLDSQESRIQGINALLGFMDIQRLVDLPFSGVHFTWTNNKTGNGVVYDRLDRAMATVNWIGHFRKASLISFKN